MTATRNGTESGKPRTVRCAIYTRKSTTENLDQDFNTLDAQREAGEAFITSQKGKKWVCLRNRYDDGGFSGGTMDRPALQRILKAVKEKRVHCIVVYRLDRLSRSLLDFAQIMQLLDQSGATFVSVSEQFNTSTSIGRLALNMIMSFAQYERELIGERTRDKMSAARRKGKWTGGMPMLGYDIDAEGGRLHVNEAEAKTVRTIFDLYLEHQSLTETVRALRERRILTKRWTTRAGVVRGGEAWTKPRLSYLLGNAVYLGKVEHRGSIYDGEHDAIIDPDVWERVQGLIRRNGRAGGRATRNKHGARLTGLLRCASCSSVMTHTYTQKGDRRYRYYACMTARRNGHEPCPTPSLPAAEVERFVIERIRGIGSDPVVRDQVLKQVRADARAGGRKVPGKADERRLVAALKEFTPVWESLSPRQQARALQLLVSEIEYDGKQETLSITFRPNGIEVLTQRGAA